MFRAQASSSAFGTPSSTPALGTTPTSAPAFGLGPSLFATPFSSQPQQQQQQQQQLQTPLFQKPASTGFGFQTTPLAKPQPSTFPNAQLTTLMAPVAPLPFSLSDLDVQAIVDAYKDEPGNPKYAFKHLLFSVTDPQFRVKPAGVSDIMWAEAMGKLEGLDRADRDRLWPQQFRGLRIFHNDLSSKMKSLFQMLRDCESPKVMRIVEALEGKAFRLSLNIKGEAELAEKLAAITRQLKRSGAELSRRVQNLLSLSRVQVNGIGAGGTVYLSRSSKIDEQSFADMQEVLQQQTEAIAGIGNILKQRCQGHEDHNGRGQGTDRRSKLIV